MICVKLWSSGLQQAYHSGQVRLVRRIHALLFIIEGKPVDEVAAMLDLGEQTVRDYVNAFLWRGVASLSYQKPAGRPSKLTKTQRKELAALIKAGSEAAGYTTGCWSAVLIQDLLLRTFGVEYHHITSVRCWTNWAFRFRRRVLPRIT